MRSKIQDARVSFYCVPSFAMSALGTALTSYVGAGASRILDLHPSYDGECCFFGLLVASIPIVWYQINKEEV
jgi:hypothetical protein